MKKTILLMLPFALGLAACSGGSPLDKGNIITPKFMERNFVNANTPVEKLVDEKVDEKVEVGKFSPYSYIDAKRNNWVFRDEESKTGIYSISAGKFLVECGDYTLGDDLYVESIDFGGSSSYFFVAGVADESGDHVSWTIVDEFGNKAFELTADAGSYPSLSGRVLDLYERQAQDEYAVVFLSDYMGAIEEQYAVYKLDGSISRSGKYAEFGQKAGEAYGLGYGMRMDVYGHPELAVVTSNDGASMRYAFYNVKESKFVASYSVPAGAATFVAGDFFIAQQAVEVEERATEYDFYDAGAKYDLTTTRINITNGNKEELDTKLLFAGSAGEELFDEKGIVKYHYFQGVKVIRDDKALDNNVYGYFLDENLNIAADITGISWLDMEKYGDYYFDFENNVIYDGKLNEVAYVPTWSDVSESGIVFDSEGFKGLMGWDGKIILPAVYYGVEETGEGIYNAYDSQGEKFFKVENGSASELASFKKGEWDWDAYYNIFRSISVYVDEEANEKLYDGFHGAEFTAFEPAETDTLLGYLNQVSSGTPVAITGLGGTFEGYVQAYQTADGGIYLLREYRTYSFAYPTFAE